MFLQKKVKFLNSKFSKRSIFQLNVWTADGKILYKDGNNNKVELYYD